MHYSSLMAGECRGLHGCAAWGAGGRGILVQKWCSLVIFLGDENEVWPILVSLGKPNAGLEKLIAASKMSV